MSVQKNLKMGAQLCRLRGRAGYSMRKFATLVGVSYMSVYLYEHDKQIPSVATARRMAEVLGVTVDKLLQEEEPEHASVGGLII